MNFINNLKKYWFPILIIFIVTLNALIFLPKYGAWSGPSDVEYNEIGINLTQGEGFSLAGEKTMFREPAYPFFLFLNYRIFGVNHNIIRIEQFILLFLIIYLTYKIAYKIFNIFTARVASTAIALLPIFPVYATDLISEVFAAFLLLLFLYIFLRSIEFQSKDSLWSPRAVLGKVSLSGAVFGLLVLTKSIFIFLPIFILPIYLLKDRKLGLQKIFLFIFVCFIIISPWVYRNYINFEKVSIADRGGMLLYLHSIKSEFNNDELKDYAVAALSGEYIVRLYNSEFNIVEGEGIYLMNEKRASLLESGLNSSQVDEEMAREAKGLYLKHPFKNLFIGLLEVAKANTPMAPKYSIMFAFPGDVSMSVVGKLIKVIIILTIRFLWIGMLLLAVFGMMKSVRDKNIGAIMALAIVLYLNSIIFFLQGVPRFVFVIYPIYFIFFAFALSYILKWKEGKFSLENE